MTGEPLRGLADDVRRRFLDRALSLCDSLLGPPGPATVESVGSCVESTDGAGFSALVPRASWRDHDRKRRRLCRIYFFAGRGGEMVLERPWINATARGFGSAVFGNRVGFCREVAERRS